MGSRDYLRSDVLRHKYSILKANVPERYGKMWSQSWYQHISKASEKEHSRIIGTVISSFAWPGRESCLRNYQ